jgi:hypothetical protein
MAGALRDNQVSITHDPGTGSEITAGLDLDLNAGTEFDPIRVTDVKAIAALPVFVLYAEVMAECDAVSIPFIGDVAFRMLGTLDLVHRKTGAALARLNQEAQVLLRFGVPLKDRVIILNPKI